MASWHVVGAILWSAAFAALDRPLGLSSAGGASWLTKEAATGGVSRALVTSVPAVDKPACRCGSRRRSRPSVWRAFGCPKLWSGRSLIAFRWGFGRLWRRSVGGRAAGGDAISRQLSAVNQTDGQFARSSRCPLGAVLALACVERGSPVPSLLSRTIQRTAPSVRSAC